MDGQFVKPSFLERFRMSKVNARIILTVLFLGLSLSSARAAALSGDGLVQSGPANFVYRLGDMSIAGMDQLVRQKKQPAACVAKLDGELAMNSKAQVCLCDGEAKLWKTVSNGAACIW